MQPVGLQELIHKFEEGEGSRLIRTAFFLLALAGLAALWHIREARSFASIEAMDSAQLARELSEGRGYSTKVIRPLSLALLEEQGRPASSLLSQPHPDLANPPVFPLLLAGLFKAAPVNWSMPTGQFWRYQPEVIIGTFNQALFFAALLLVYRLALRLFDRPVGLLAMVLMALTELFWEFTTSGLSTMLLIVLFLILIDLLLRFEEAGREETPSKSRLLRLAVGAGLLVVAMALTRYSMGWLILPVALFLGWTAPGSVRVPAVLVAVVLFLAGLSPWVMRNYQLCGTAFGTAGLGPYHESAAFPGHVLDRSMPRRLQSELSRTDPAQFLRKLFVNGNEILTSGFPQAGGNWIGAFFLGSLLIPFRNPALTRLKTLTAGLLLLFLLVQAIGRTGLSAHAPTYNSENLLVIFSPLFFIFGAGFFFILLDQVEFSAPWLRSLAVVMLVAVMSLPLCFRLLPPGNSPAAYPPYYPPVIQTVAAWLRPDELVMTDMPWAVAWYGQRQSVWTTLDSGAKPADDFYRINDEIKAIKGIFLSPITTNARFLTEMRQSREGIWGKFYLDAVVMKNLPKGFPLTIGPPGLFPEWLFLSDRIRWRQ